MRSPSLARGPAVLAPPAIAATKMLSAERRVAVFDGARPGFADRHEAWPAFEARH
jgi:hypothetical protein